MTKEALLWPLVSLEFLRGVGDLKAGWSSSSQPHFGALLHEIYDSTSHQVGHVTELT